MKKANNFSPEYKSYLRRKKRKNIVILSIQIGILVLIIGLWEILACTGVIDTFILSSPSRILDTTIELYRDGSLFLHAGTTLLEALIGFVISTILGSLIAIVLWWNESIRRVLEPYIVVLNSLPKIALGPVLIIWIGVGTKAIVAMDILIMIVITILSMLNAFMAVDNYKIQLLKSMGANKIQILSKLILPHALPEFISVLKINVGLTWIGTIMGEYLVSRAGLGYLIVYGSQVFDLDLVMTSTFILCILAALMYFAVASIEKFVYKKRGRK